MMRTVVCLTFFLLASASQAAPCEDPVGAWRLNLVSPDGKARECIVVIARDGTTLKATCSTNGIQMPVKETVFDQGVLSVRIDGEYVGQAYALIYKGKPVGGKLQGTAHWSYGWASGRIPFRGERISTTIAAVP